MCSSDLHRVRRHAGPGRADPGDPVRRRRVQPERLHGWRALHGVRAVPVPGRARPRRAVRPARPPPPAALQPRRIRRGLRRLRPRPLAADTVCRAHHRRHLGRQHLDRAGGACGSLVAGGPVEDLRAARRIHRTGLHSRSRDRRRAVERLGPQGAGDRRSHQMDPANVDEALHEVRLTEYDLARIKHPNGEVVPAIEVPFEIRFKGFIPL